jgi:hypothetical protein
VIWGGEFFLGVMLSNLRDKKKRTCQVIERKFFFKEPKVIGGGKFFFA